MYEQTLGVLGGMGPSATVNFVDKIIESTPAELDQDNIPMIIYNDPRIPDRNTAILEDTKSPLPALKQLARSLESQGVDFIAMPCNTAHYYHQPLSDAIDVPLLNMIEETERTLQNNNIETAGLLATSTVIRAGIYDSFFSESSIELSPPDDVEMLMDVIYDIKKGEYESAQQSFHRIISDFASRDVDALIIACTDLSVLSANIDIPTFDATTILAEACVEWF